MTNEEFWALKIVALLHDPPGKALDLGGHEPRAFATIERIIGPRLFLQLFGEPAARLQRGQDFERLEQNSPNYQRLKRADAMASAMDRTAFPARVKIESRHYVPTACVVHPLSGKQRLLGSIPRQFCDAQGRYDQQAADDYQVARLRDAEQLAQGQPDLRRAYLRLWRGLPLTSPDVDAVLLPPDTRIVDHSLWQHLDATAAVLSALPRPALLVFSVGPVQSFIAEARRTQDLWMGSYLLSYLTWSGIRTLVEEVGPDTVLYPALRGQPLVDHWLHCTFCSPLWEDAPQADDLAVATFPNKFVALLSYCRATELATAAAAAVRQAWIEIADKVKQSFPGGPQAGDWETIWRRQVEAKDWPEIYWSVLPWPDTDQYAERSDEAEAAITLDETYLGSPPSFRKTLNVYKQAWRKGINSGTLYGRLHALAEAGFTARKGLRDFLHAPLLQGQTRQLGEDGEKCTVSGVRSALRPDGARHRDGVRRYWQGVAQRLRNTEGRYHEVKPDGSERLSAIVAIKRFAQRDYFEDAIGLQGGFPSTTQVTAAPFKAAVLQKLTDAALAAALCKHLEGLKAVRFPTLSEQAARLSLPHLTRRYERLPSGLSDLGWEFLRFDADVLYPSTFTREGLEREYRLTVSEAQAAGLAESCRKLIRAARDAGIDPPVTYYAVLLMDGDRMGAWLAGEGLPRFQDVFHPDAPSLFQQLPDYTSSWKPIIESSRPLSAALHNSISLALSNFALECVRQVVEDCYVGRVVYAGGDDLLALLPAEYVLAAARDLRALYSGQAGVEVGADGWRVNPDFSGDHTGFLQVGDQVLLTMGPTATASVGIVIAHHQAPLDGVLAAAREAEKAAKEVYRRNAICVYALKRSGEALRVGGRWHYRGRDLVAQVEQIRSLFSQGLVSSKFAYEVYDRTRAFSRRVYDPIGNRWQSAGPPWGAWAAMIHRLVKRHWQGDRDLQKAEANRITKLLAFLTVGLSRHRYHWEQQWWQHHDREPDPLDEDYAPQPGPVELGKWLLLARFLETGGEE